MNQFEVENHLLRTAMDKKWAITPDMKKYNSLVRSMTKKARGDKVICPCKVFVEGLVDIALVVCPCGEADGDIKENGACHCGIFVKPEA